MTARVALVAGIGIGLLAAWAPGPVSTTGLLAAQNVQQHDQHHQGMPPKPDAAAAPNMMMSNMMAADAKLDELVRKMNEAKGQARIDAIAEVVTALVDQHKAMHGMMAGRMGMMNRPAPPAATPAQPEK